jgi:hypothetical protein
MRLFASIAFLYCDEGLLETEESLAQDSGVWKQFSHFALSRLISAANRF